MGGGKEYVRNDFMVMRRSLQLFVFIFVFCRLAIADGDPPRIRPYGSGILIEIEPDPDYPDAIAKESLNLACFDTVQELRKLFEDHNLPFEKGLLREEQGRKCHIFYEPTVVGFRASPDDEPIEEVWADVDLLKFISQHAKSYGYVTGIIKTIAETVPRPLVFHIGMPLAHSPEVYASAIRFYFPESHHQFRLFNTAVKEAREWIQDYLKSGSASGQRTILITRNHYEGDYRNGEHNRLLLDSFQAPQFVPSKLSWEGGDLQFVRHPRQPKKLLLFYGDSAFNYWGKHLTDEEYSYVLRLEFGADQAIDLSTPTSHVDYFVSFLPQDRIALAGKPLIGDFNVARDALNLLKAYFPGAVPSEILTIEEILRAQKLSSKQVRDRLLRAVDAARKAHAGWKFPLDPAFEAELEEFFAAHCSNESDGCVEDGRLSLKAQKLLLANNPGLLRDWVDMARIIRSSQDFVLSCLAIIESQLRELIPENKAIRESKVRKLQELGFRVIRVPQIGGRPDFQTAWPGVSYVNSLLVDNLLFLPIFGLDSFESQLVHTLENELPERYQVIPTMAQHMIVYNGGIHCMLAIVRRLSDQQASR